MPGPLPNPQARRRNQPTIPTDALPAEGRKGRAPKCPRALGKAGAAWWKWAWGLPQATRWDKGALYFAARRAELEDMVAAIGLVDDVDLAELLAVDIDDDQERRAAVRQIEFAIGTLKGIAGGKVAVMKEMRELDNRLGLNPKAMLDLRWTLAETPAAPAAAPKDEVEARRRKRVQAVDPAAIG